MRQMNINEFHSVWEFYFKRKIQGLSFSPLVKHKSPYLLPSLTIDGTALSPHCYPYNLTSYPYDSFSTLEYPQHTGGESLSIWKHWSDHFTRVNDSFIILSTPPQLWWAYRTLAVWPTTNPGLSPVLLAWLIQFWCYLRERGMYLSSLFSGWWRPMSSHEINTFAPKSFSISHFKALSQEGHPAQSHASNVVCLTSHCWLWQKSLSST